MRWLRWLTQLWATRLCEARIKECWECRQVVGPLRALNAERRQHVLGKAYENK